MRATLALTWVACASSFRVPVGTGSLPPVFSFAVSSTRRLDGTAPTIAMLHHQESTRTPLSWAFPALGAATAPKRLYSPVLRARGGGLTKIHASASIPSVIDEERLYQEAKPVKWEKDGNEYDIGGWSAHTFEAQKDKESEATGENAGSGASEDWVQALELTRAKGFGHDADPPLPPTAPKHKPRVLVLYGSLRPESFSRKLALECARILDMLGCDIRVYNPRGLPLRDPAIEDHPKVQELRALSDWSEGHVWISPEMHGEVTGTFKTQIDWLPLNTGSVRPTQGRSVMIAQVNGGSQSFNVVNSLRKLARWMRMNCVTNQSSVPKAWKEFDEHGRMKPSEFRDRVVDVCEEFYKYTLILRPFADFLVDRYSERKEKVEQGRLLTQAEKEKAKDAAAGKSKAALMAQVNEKMNK